MKRSKCPRVGILPIQNNYRYFSNGFKTTDYIVTELARRDLYDTVRIKGALRRVSTSILRPLGGVVAQMIFVSEKFRKTQSKS